jgi:tetratricopeptide (TPR) repeat protein
MPKQRRNQSPRRTAKKAAPARQKLVRVTKAARPVHTVAAVRRTTARPATSRAVRRPATKVPAKGSPARPAKANPVLVRGKRAGKTAAARSGARPIQAVAPTGPSQHDLAFNAFERGFQALQQRQFGRAAELLSVVVNNFPDEKEIQERARVYLSICERQAATRDSRPRSFEERVNAATVAINRAAFDEGLALLRKLEAEDSENDHVQYMLGVVYGSVGDIEQALAHLRNAIELNPENRFLSTQDADLESLRQHAGFAAMIETQIPRRRVAAKRR